MCHDALTLPVALCTATGLISMQCLCVPLLHVCDTYLTAISLYKRAAIVCNNRTCLSRKESIVFPLLLTRGLGGSSFGNL